MSSCLMTLDKAMAGTARSGLAPPLVLDQDEQKHRTAAAFAIILSRKQSREASQWRERAIMAEEQLATARALIQTGLQDNTTTDGGDNTPANASCKSVSIPGPAAVGQGFELDATRPRPAARSDASALGRQHGLEVMLHHACQLLPTSIVEHEAWTVWHGPSHPTPTSPYCHKALAFIDALMALPASDLRRRHVSACVDVLAAAVTSSIASASEKPLACKATQDVLQLAKHLLKLAAQQRPQSPTITPMPGPDSATLVLQSMQAHPTGTLLQLVMLACAQECEAATTSMAHQHLPDSAAQHNSGTLLSDAIQQQRHQSTAVRVFLGCLDHLPQALDTSMHNPATSTASAQAPDTQRGAGLPLLQEAVSMMCRAWGTLQRSTIPCLHMALRAALLRVMARLATMLQQIGKTPRMTASGSEDAAMSDEWECVQDTCLQLCMQLRRSFEP